MKLEYKLSSKLGVMETENSNDTNLLTWINTSSDQGPSQGIATQEPG